MNKLTQELAAQQQITLQANQQLEESVQQIVAVHMQVANGNFKARVPLDQKNVLWSLAGSLNNLLARLQRWRQEAQQLQHVERSIQQTLSDIQLAKTQRTPLIYRRTGTMLDPLVAEFIGGSSPDYLSHPQMEKITPIPGQSFQQQMEKMTPIPGQPFQQQMEKMTPIPGQSFQQQMEKMTPIPGQSFQQQMEKMTPILGQPFQQQTER